LLLDLLACRTARVDLIARAALALVCALAACSSGRDPGPVTMPAPVSPIAQQKLEWQAAKRTFDQRCVVCHGCYDAPCQLKLSSWDGVARGASKRKVYQASRLREAAPTRLNIDAHDLRSWRVKDFHPVLPENEQTDPRLALLTRMLALKQENPLELTGKALPKEFEIGLDREEQCPTADEFDDFKQHHPSWGMPYALPGLVDAEHQTLVDWVARGTPHEPLAALAPAVEESIARWETFFNAPGLKQQLVARYIYEHLFLGSLYFEGLDEQTLFRLVRSRTPSDQPVDEIATRRPFEDPGALPFYYRFVRRDDTRLSKTQMPYALSDERLVRYRELFLEPDYVVTKLPSYARSTSANPFSAFAALPVGARYRFMLEEAWFTMAGFIKGPVCRGQVALNVIEDRFWITFIDPESPIIEEEARLLAGAVDDLALPAEMGSNNLLVTWRGYARRERRFLEAKSKYLSELAANTPLALADIWDGDGTNANAALTVLRHFDSATVVKGLVGDLPKTSWVIDYSLLERIHYLLVAGYDVFGNIGHQLQSRMYMDFLRMEAEYNFLVFLPKARRKPLMESWYRGASDEVKDHVYGEYAYFKEETELSFTTETPERELAQMLSERVATVLNHAYDLDTEPATTLRDALLPVAKIGGEAATLMPETSFVEVQRAGGGQTYFTILRDSAHTNVAEIFEEDERRRPLEDRLVTLRGFVGAYPNALFSVREDELSEFVDSMGALDADKAYDALRERFGVRRTDARFWELSDRAHAAFGELDPLESGLFDYNRLDGR
jgi:Fatty acid cis/trans isomerase (CTI)